MIYRLYIFVPFNDNKYGPYATVCGSLPNGCYNTGRYDDQAAGAMRCGDARQFGSLQDLLVYAQSQNETPMQADSIEQVNALCTASVSPTPPVNLGPPVAPTEPKPPQVFAGTPIPQTSPGPGAPPVINVTDSPSEPTQYTTGAKDVAIYRLILESGPNRFDTGATYEGCSRATPNNCKPMQFASLDDAISFARDHGEIPVKVNSEADAWDIVEGRKPVDESNVLAGAMNPLVLAGAAVAAAFILPKLLKGKRA